MKEPEDRAVKKSISLPQGLLDKATARQRNIGLTKFSDYLQALIRADIARNANLSPLRFGRT